MRCCLFLPLPVSSPNSRSKTVNGGGKVQNQNVNAAISLFSRDVPGERRKERFFPFAGKVFQTFNNGICDLLNGIFFIGHFKSSFSVKKHWVKGFLALRLKPFRGASSQRRKRLSFQEKRRGVARLATTWERKSGKPFFFHQATGN